MLLQHRKQMLKKISNMRFKFRVLIWGSYISFGAARFMTRMYEFRFFNPDALKQRKAKGKKKALKVNIKLFRGRLNFIKKQCFGYMKFIKHSIINNSQKPYEISIKVRTNVVSDILFIIVGYAWFYEKLHINPKFVFPDEYNFFKNSRLRHSKKVKSKCINTIKLSTLIPFSKGEIPSQYGYKIISRLTIKEKIQRQTDEWINSDLRGDWLGVHYRGTDLAKTGRKYRLIKIETYIAYLKEVLDDRYSIFACSDQVQFIEQIHSAFPGRVYSRDIARSNDETPLHRRSKYAGHQQKQDAFIDLLILSKASLVYTSGSYFIDAVRFLNPSIKIISLDGRKVCYKHIPNYLPCSKL